MALRIAIFNKSFKADSTGSIPRHYNEAGLVVKPVGVAAVLRLG